MERCKPYDDLCFFDPVESGDPGFGYRGGRDGPGDGVHSRAGGRNLQCPDIQDQMIRSALKPGAIVVK